MRLRGEIVDLVRPRLLHDADDVGGIGHVPVVQMKGDAGLVRIVNEMIKAGGVEG